MINNPLFTEIHELNGVRVRHNTNAPAGAFYVMVDPDKDLGKQEFLDRLKQEPLFPRDPFHTAQPFEAAVDAVKDWRRKQQEIRSGVELTLEYLNPDWRDLIGQEFTVRWQRSQPTGNIEQTIIPGSVNEEDPQENT